MDYGENFLTKDSIDWALVNTFMSPTQISIGSGGQATTKIKKAQSNGIKESYKLTLIANRYTDPYNPDMFAVLDIIYDEDNTFGTVKLPIVDTGKGAFSAEVPMRTGDFTSFKLTFTGEAAFVITDWSMSCPASDVEQIVDGVRQEIPKLLFDYNTSIFEITTEELTIGLITADLLENTDLNGHIEVAYESPSEKILTIRIRDNDITELYTPILYNIKAGRGAIGIPHAYLKKLLGIHTFAVTAQVNTGTMTVLTRGTLCTIDGGHMARRLMDIDIDIRDLTVRQMIDETSPSVVYAVGMEDNMARVRSVDFVSGASSPWNPEYEVGPAVDAAIEFNGYWIERPSDEGYTIITDEKPYVFWITPEGTLLGQRGLETATLQTFNTSVTAVSAIRGFKSMETVGQDQGLIVAYIKNGAVYYKAYCEQPEGGYVWENEHQLIAAGSGNTAIHIGRLNDYRVFFAISNPAGNKLFLTDRTYVGLAVKSERVSIIDTSLVQFQMQYRNEYKSVTVEHISMADSYNSFVLVENVNDIQKPNLMFFEADAESKVILMQFDVPLYGMDNSIIPYITITPTNTITNIEQIAPNAIIVTFQNAVNVAVAMRFATSRCYAAGFVRQGRQFFGDDIWDIEFVPAAPDLDEEVMVVDGHFNRFQFVDQAELFGEVQTESIEVLDTTIFNVTLTPIGTVPI